MWYLHNNFLGGFYGICELWLDKLTNEVYFGILTVIVIGEVEDGQLNEQQQPEGKDSLKEVSLRFPFFFFFATDPWVKAFNI